VVANQNQQMVVITKTSKV